jgi:hypothetical protein
MDPTLLPGGFAQQQVPDIRTATERDLLIADIQRVMLDFTQRTVEARLSGNIRRSPMIPYFVNRDDQEDSIEDAIDAARRDGGIWPFFIAGPENECVDEFLKRLDEHTSRRCLGGNFGWEPFEVAWPEDETETAFLEKYTRRLGAALGLRGQIKGEDLAAALNRRGRPVAIVSRWRAADWRENEGNFVRAWLKLWRDLAAVPGYRAVVPLLAIKMPKAQCGWKTVPSGGWFSGAGRRNREIWDTTAVILKEENAAVLKDDNAAAFRRPPVLAPIRQNHVDSWVSEYFLLSDVDRSTLTNKINEIFASSAYAQYGVPHADFVVKVSDLFPGTT